VFCAFHSKYSAHAVKLYSLHLMPRRIKVYRSRPTV